MRFRAEQRLRRQSDFRATRERGRRIECGGFTFWYHARQASEVPGVPADQALRVVPRVGVVASTAAVGNAGARNRAKRLLREVFRRNQQRVPGAYDLILVARRALLSQPLPQIEARFVDACRRAFPDTSHG